MCNSELTKTQQIKIYPYTKNNHINYIVQIMPKSKLYMPYLILISSTSDIYIHNIIDMKNKYLPIRNHELIPLHMLYFDIHDDYSYFSLNTSERFVREMAKRGCSAFTHSKNTLIANQIALYSVSILWILFFVFFICLSPSKILESNYIYQK
ncbi:hypothetical protein ACJX0J_038849, partial [Zea mays]